MKNHARLLAFMCMTVLAACNREPPASPSTSATPGIPVRTGSGQAPSLPPSAVEQDEYVIRHAALKLPADQKNDASKAEAGAEAKMEAAESLAGNDLNFIQRIGSDGQSQEQAALYVASKTSNNAVRNYAARMGRDHGKANHQLRTLAAKRHIEIPSDPVGQMREKLDRLRQLSGAQMDEAFLQDFGVQGHMDLIALFEVQQSQSKDAELKEFTAQQLPLLRKHYKQGKALQDKHSSASRTVDI